jgi:hypothetical protein
MTASEMPYTDRIIALLRRARAHAMENEIDEGLARLHEAIRLIVMAGVSLDQGNDRDRIMAMLRIVATDPWDRLH